MVTVKAPTTHRHHRGVPLTRGMTLAGASGNAAQLSVPPLPPALYAACEKTALLRGWPDATG